MATAVATKYDSGDLASQAQAEAETSNTVLMTPGRVANWADANGGMVGDIQALADPGADSVLGWDDSASAAIGWTIGTGLLTTAGGALELDHLGFEDLTDPGADRVVFWDETDNALNFGSAGNGLEFSAHTLGLIDVAASTTNPIDISSGAVSMDLSNLTTMDSSELAAADQIYIEDGGVSKAMSINEMGIRVKLAEVTQNIASGDMNSLMEFDGTATLTLRTNATHAIPAGTAVIIAVDHATQVVTVSANAGVTLNSIFHPGGTDNASDTVLSGGLAVLIKTATDEWYLSGDIGD